MSNIAAPTRTIGDAVTIVETAPNLPAGSVFHGTSPQDAKPPFVVVTPRIPRQLGQAMCTEDWGKFASVYGIVCYGKTVGQAEALRWEVMGLAGWSDDWAFRDDGQITFADPVRRAGWVFALQQIHQGEHVGSMIYGDTISFGRDFERNRALTAEYLQWDILAQLHCPSGHAVLPLPVTEAIRIPSAEEIIEAQLFGRRVEASARRMYPHVDFSAAESFAAQVCRDGQAICNNALDGMREVGVDINNPLQMLLVLKQLGAQHFEQLFADLPAEAELTDMYTLSQDVVEEHRYLLADEAFCQKVRGRSFIVASTDVHEHAAGALAQILSDAGANVIYLGAEQNPSDLVVAIEKHPADALLLSTHNGMALEYSRQLKDLLDGAAHGMPVVIGGVLNQKVDDQDLPVPVFDELRALGLLPVAALPGVPKLLEAKLDT